MNTVYASTEKSSSARNEFADMHRLLKEPIIKSFDEYRNIYLCQIEICSTSLKCAKCADILCRVLVGTFTKLSSIKQAPYLLL